LIIVAVIITVLVGCRDLSTDHDEDPIVTQQRTSVALDIQFEVGLGETVVVEGTDLEVTFSAVTHDYRCPSDVQCIHAGEAGIDLSVTDSLGLHSQVLITIPGLVLTPYRLDNVTRHRDWQFRLLRLNPYPDTGQPHDEKDYRALVVIESQGYGV